MEPDSLSCSGLLATGNEGGINLGNEIDLSSLDLFQLAKMSN